MLYISDAQLDQWLLDDLPFGDLTTRSLGISKCYGKIIFRRKSAGKVSGVYIAHRLLQKLELNSHMIIQDGDDVAAGTILLQATGLAWQLHAAWKVVQNVLEWTSGVADVMSQMVKTARFINPSIQIACTRKCIPGTKLLATQAILDGGGIVHRAGASETILLFTNHRNFFNQPDNWVEQINLLRRNAPEKMIIVEADTPQQAIAVLAANPDILQMDKFTPEQIRMILAEKQKLVSNCRLSAAGGIRLDNIQEYAATGIDILVTSSPYYAEPVDIKVELLPQNKE